MVKVNCQFVFYVVTIAESMMRILKKLSNNVRYYWRNQT